MINVTYRIFSFLPCEKDSFEEYLEVMARKGCLVEKIGPLLIKFRKIEAKNIKYRIDVVEHNEFYLSEKNFELIEQRKKYKEAGWNFTCEGPKIQVYSAEEEKEIVEVKYDEKEKFEKVSKVTKKYIYPNILAPLILLIGNLFIVSQNYGIGVLASGAQICNIICVTLFTSVYILRIIGYIGYRVKGKRRLKENKSVIYERFKLLSVKPIITIISILFMFVYGYYVQIYPYEIYDEKPYKLTLQDFGDKANPEHNYREIIDKSPLATYTTYVAKGEEIYLSYELFEGNYKWVTSVALNKFFDHNPDYKVKESNLPENIKVYLNKKNDNYIMVSDKKIVIIDLYQIVNDENEDELLNILYNKIFKL